MGRKKITIKQISDPKLRHITFNKRKNGLIKKAAELSVLCNVNMLLVFEDDNGNLIQFTKTPVSSIPEFFESLRYSNVLEFSAEEYPTFFKVNHYKKTKDREGNDYDQDEMDYCDDEDGSPVYAEESPVERPKKKLRMQSSNYAKEEDRMAKMIYHSGASEEEDDNNEMLDNMNTYEEPQMRGVPQAQAQTIQKMSPKMNNKPEQKQQQKVYVNNDDDGLNMTPLPEQEPIMNRKDSFQSFRGMKNLDYQPQFNGLENSFKRTNQQQVNQVNDQNNSFRYFNESNTNGMNNMNMQQKNANNFNNNSKIQNNKQFLNNNNMIPNNNLMNINLNNPNINMNINQNHGFNQVRKQNHAHSHGHGHHAHNHSQNRAFKPIGNNFNSHKAQILQGLANLGMGFSNMVNMNNFNNMNTMNSMNAMSTINNMGNMGNMSNEETLNAMLKGLPLGFMNGSNSFMAKNNKPAEMDEKLLDTANMIKYLNNTNTNNTYSSNKMYNFQATETGKNDETDNMYQNNQNYDNESEYNDQQQQFMRGDFRLDNNMPSNLPSAYFSSKKFNFDGYFNNLEEDKFNEFGDPKKKPNKA